MKSKLILLLILVGAFALFASHGASGITSMVMQNNENIGSFNKASPADVSLAVTPSSILSTTANSRQDLVGCVAELTTMKSAKLSNGALPCGVEIVVICPTNGVTSASISPSASISMLPASDVRRITHVDGLYVATCTNPNGPQGHTLIASTTDRITAGNTLNSSISVRTFDVVLDDVVTEQFSQKLSVLTENPRRALEVAYIVILPNSLSSSDMTEDQELTLSAEVETILKHPLFGQTEILTTVAGITLISSSNAMHFDAATA